MLQNSVDEVTKQNRTRVKNLNFKVVVVRGRGRALSARIWMGKAARQATQFNFPMGNVQNNWRKKYRTTSDVPFVAAFHVLKRRKHEN